MVPKTELLKTRITFIAFQVFTFTISQESYGIDLTIPFHARARPEKRAGSKGIFKGELIPFNKKKKKPLKKSPSKEP